MPNDNEDFAAIQAAAVARAVAEDRTRHSVIFASEGAKAHPALANLLFSDGVAADKAASYLKAASDATEAAVKAATPEKDTKAEQEAAARAEAARKTKAGTIGLGLPESTERSSASTGWAKAIANANRGVRSISA
ncbi:MAG: hypothetical protein EOS72_03100 [Mesorhizobium sp.]|uniref:hypothetical protein n=1 Tax=Mesorhizobium sp. TaxID=1871066 RepID=UPI000FE5CE13|nr:hypothetical protein [Mesorhizobium sp.]RWC91656.1 MAG: hypothetical protein EOS72_03100 [Mesorhizobium sp.]